MSTTYAVSFSEVCDRLRTDRVCFFIGAGCSDPKPSTGLPGAGRLDLKKFPTTKEVTNKLLELMLGSDISKRILRVAGGGVRFEYLMGLIRDYVAPFSFLRDIYGESSVLPNSYHYVLARLLADDKACVVTTNFDLQIEGAHRALNRASSPLRVLYEDADFIAASGISNRASGLFKLHGSLEAEDMDTLGVTFDSTQPSEPKSSILATILQSHALVVIGYSGMDDADIVPVLQRTKSTGKPIVWINYDGTAESNEVYSGAEIARDDLPDHVKSEKCARILRNIAIRHSRSVHDVYLAHGRSEPMFYDLVKYVFGVQPVQSKTIEIPRIEVDDTHWWRGIIDRWYRAAGKDRRFWSLLAATDFSYGVAESSVMQTMARRLKKHAANDDLKKLLTLPTEANAEFEADDYEKCAEAASRGALEISQALERWDPDHKRDRELLGEALVECYIWQGEALRMLGKTEQAIAASRTGLAEAAKLKPKGVVGSRHLARLRGDLKSTLAEVSLVSGDLRSAEKLYGEAESLFLKAAELNWVWYARLGIADTWRSRGWLRKGDEAYRQIVEGTKDIGFTHWMSPQLLVNRIDVALVQGQGDLKLREVGEFLHLAVSNVTVGLQQAGEDLRRYLSWVECATPSKATVGWYQRSLKRAKADEDYAVARRLVYAELLKFLNRFADANKECSAVTEVAGNKGYKLLELHARAVQEDIRRMQKEPPRWQELAEAYLRSGCDIGWAYAIAMALLYGDRVAQQDSNKFYKYVRNNRLVRLWETVRTGCNRRDNPPQLYLVFPNVLTAF